MEGRDRTRRKCDGRAADAELTFVTAPKDEEVGRAADEGTARRRGVREASRRETGRRRMQSNSQGAHARRWGQTQPRERGV